MSDGSERLIRLEFKPIGDISAPLADHMNINNHTGVFVLSFFETRFPVLTGTPEERKAQALNVDSIEAVCVSRVSIPANRIEDVIGALQTSLESFKSIRNKLENQT